jgi:beta-1,4-mannosyl-glycoprotein beta-1,4-N-acetylglucosaminyltransferase
LSYDDDEQAVDEWGLQNCGQMSIVGEVRLKVIPRAAGDNRPRIYDAFIFYNELELLEIRLNELYDIVDRFVLVESDRTFTNLAKPLYFNESRERFSRFLDKIEYVFCRSEIEDKPNHSDEERYRLGWAREHAQRTCIERGLNQARSNDIVILGDADELLRRLGRTCKSTGGRSTERKTPISFHSSGALCWP